MVCLFHIHALCLTYPGIVEVGGNNMNTIWMYGRGLQVFLSLNAPFAFRIQAIALYRHLPVKSTH